MGLQLVLRNKLKYALTGRECDIILGDKDNTVKVDNKVRRDKKYPVGLMDVISIPKTGDNYRMLYDVKGRFTLVKIKNKDEQNIKLARLRRELWVQTKSHMSSLTMLDALDSQTHQSTFSIPLKST